MPSSANLAPFTASVTLAGALLLIAFAALATVDFVMRARSASGRLRYAHIFLGTIATLGALSAAQILAQMAYTPTTLVAVDSDIYVSGLVLTAIKLGIGFLLATELKGRAAFLASGLVFGLAIPTLPIATGVATSLLQGASASTMTPVLVIGAMTGLVAASILRIHRSIISALAASVAAAGGTLVTAYAYTLLLREGQSSALPGDMQNASMAAGAGITIFMMLVLGNILYDRRTSRPSRQDERGLLQLAEHAFDGIMIHDGRRITSISEALTTRLGYEQDILANQNLAGFTQRQDLDAFRAILSHSSVTLPVILPFAHADGSHVRFETFTRKIADNPQSFITGFRELKPAENDAASPLRDPLTHLPNRLLLQDRFEQALLHARQEQDHLAVLRINLAGVEHLRTTLGEDGLVDAITSMADVIRFVIRDTDTLGRIENTSFLIIQTASDQPSACEKLGRDIIDALTRPLSIRGQTIQLKAVIGAAIYPWDGETVDTLMEHAAIAAARATGDAGYNLRFYEQGADASFRSRRSLEHDLRAALENNEFSLAFQPQLALSSDEVVGFEALLRWNHPRRGVVSPAEFIPLAEETGLIIPIGAWVIAEACRTAGQWAQPLRVAVNVAPQQFASRGFVDTVDSILRESGFDPSRLELEITESSVITDVARSRQLLWDLKERGIEVAIDDFGTGYSSLAYLREFRFDKLKIDRSFVTGIDYRENSLAIVRAVIALSRALGLQVIAEGVETPAEMERLKDEGCDEIQGFLLSRPMPASEIASFLARHQQNWAKPAPARLRPEPRLLALKGGTDVK